MDDAMYAVTLDSGTEGVEVVHAGIGRLGLRDCQAYAQRITETNQGSATVGIFKPLTINDQRGIMCQK